MRRRIALLVLVVVALATTACGAGGGAATASAPAASAVPDITPAASATSTPVSTPSAIVVSVTGLTLIDGTNASLATAPFSDGAGVLALLSGAIGSVPAGRADAQSATTTYDWGAITLVVSAGGAARISIGEAMVGDLRLRADAGIAVGSAVGAAMAQGAMGDPSDPALLRFEVTEAPGTSSLTTAGATGVDFVALVTDGTAVTRILAPADDYSDL